MLDTAIWGAMIAVGRVFQNWMNRDESDVRMAEIRGRRGGEMKRTKKAMEIEAARCRGSGRGNSRHESATSLG